MSIRIQCPSCKVSCTVGDECKGKRIRCTFCDGVVAVPGPDSGIVDKKGATLPARGPDRRDSKPDRPASPRNRDGGRAAGKKSGIPFLLVALLGGGVLAVLGVIVVVVGLGGWFLFGSRAPAAPEDRAPIAMNVDRPKPADAPVQPAPVQPAPGQPAPRQPDPIVNAPPREPPPNADVPLPDKIADATIQNVKRSTAYLHVTMRGGGKAEGTGFFAIEPGIVVTNAHVIGMLSANSPTPDSVDVVVNSGEPNEITLRGTVLGVDRFTDLAILRVAGNGAPPPLPVHSARQLKDLQKLYYFGFPHGKQLGANITIAEATVSSIRKDPSGAIEQVQLTGNMQPGNSGGPVVNSAGRVVGVARAIIVGTGINFAIPADKVKLAINGRVSDTAYGEPYVQGNGAMLPVNVRCLDPLGRIRTMKVDVWAGNAGPKRPFAYERPAPLPGDGPHQQVTIPYQNGAARGEVPLPAAGPGQVVWIQPVLTDGAGVTHWHTAASVKLGTPLQRVPATLRLKLDQAGEHSVTMKYSEGVTVYEGKRKFTEGLTFDANLLEIVTPKSGAGAEIRVWVGANRFAEVLDGRQRTLDAQYHRRLSALLSPTFKVDGSGKMRQRVTPNVNPNIIPRDKAILEGMIDRFCNAYEQSILIMPNRELAPMQSWQASIPNFVGKGRKAKVVDIILTFTYLGTRATGGRNHAVIDMVGLVRDKRMTKPMGKATGRAAFDIEGGYIAELKTRIASEHDLGPNLQFVVAENVEQRREPGNRFNIVARAPSKPPEPPAQVKGTVILNKNGQITVKSPFDQERPGVRYKAYELGFDAGKTYVIEMRMPPGSTLDPYLKLFDPSGTKVAEDDDGGGNLDARIVYKAKAAGRYRIIAESFAPDRLGAYRLTVTVLDGGKLAKDSPNPKSNPTFDGTAKGFAKPAKSAMRTSYLKIVSSPGDRIGQGKSYEYPGAELQVRKTPRGVNVRVGGWTLNIGGPQGQFLKPGEYRDAQRFAFSGTSPGLDFHGNGRGSNRVAGAFVVWELAVQGDQITRLAIDFVQHSESTDRPPLTGKLRLNSTLK